MKELLIRLDTWAYYHRIKAILLFIPLTFVAWFGSLAISNALPLIGKIVFGIITLTLAVAFVVYCARNWKELGARKTKV